LTLQPDRTTALTRPDGTLAHRGRTTNQRPPPTALSRFERPAPNAA
jgi:hypothetical protein